MINLLAVRRGRTLRGDGRERYPRRQEDGKDYSRRLVLSGRIGTASRHRAVGQDPCRSRGPAREARSRGARQQCQVNPSSPYITLRHGRWLCRYTTSGPCYGEDQPEVAVGSGRGAGAPSSDRARRG